MWSAQLPVCARCTGIYVGAAAVAVAVAASDRAAPVWGCSTVVRADPSTLVFEWTTGIAPSNGIRAATGVLLGAAVMAILLAEVRYTD